MKIPIKSQSLNEWFQNLKEFQLDNHFQTSVLARAYEHTHIVQVSKEENKLSATIQGSENYRLSIMYTEGHIVGQCSCPFKSNCKHLAALILKNIKRSDI